MSMRSRIVILLVVMIACIGADRITKSIAQEHLAYARPISLLGNSVRFEYVENRGAFLGLGGDLPPTVRFVLLVVVSGALLPVTMYFALRSPSVNTMRVIALSLIAGGGVGNMIDRLTGIGGVVDFVSVGIGPLRTGIFNLADFAITIGVCMLFVMWGRSARGNTQGRVDGGTAQPLHNLPLLSAVVALLFANL